MVCVGAAVVDLFKAFSKTFFNKLEPSVVCGCGVCCVCCGVVVVVAAATVVVGIGVVRVGVIGVVVVAVGGGVVIGVAVVGVG